ncbi:MAG: PDZ domain-containing protein [Planctomycetota bacterium]|jgi:hypothetical protein
MKRMMTGVALMALAAGCASTAHADGKKAKSVEHQVVVTSDSEKGESKKIEIRIEDGNVVKFLVNGKEVDPDEVDWTDGFVSFGDGDGANAFFIASPDEDFDFEFDNEASFTFSGEGNRAFFHTDAPDAPRRAVLGVRVEDSEDGGIRIVGLTDGGAAKASGLEVGDVIVKLDGDKADGVPVLLKKLEGKDPGDTMKVVVLRGDDDKTFKVKLRGNPEVSERAEVFAVPRGEDNAHFEWKSDEDSFEYRVAPRAKMDEHRRIILDRHHGKLREKLGEHNERLQGLHEEHIIRLKGLHEGQMLKLERLDELEGHILKLEELDALKELKHLEHLEGLEGLKVLEELKGELHQLKMFDDEDGRAFAFAFGGEAGSCDCDCQSCEDCEGGAGEAHGTMRWAPRADEIKKRMHVELRERAGKMRKHKAFDKAQRVEMEKQLEHARKALENIEIDIDMPEIEVIIESLGGEDGNVVFVPDAPKMRNHWVTRHKSDDGDDEHVVVEVAPEGGKIRKRAEKEGAADKLERESRLARFEERLERLEKLIKKLMHERDED